MLYESCDEKIRNKRIRIALLEFKMFLKCGAVATYENVNNVCILFIDNLITFEFDCNSYNLCINSVKTAFINI